jgi:hypothetical protein
MSMKPNYLIRVVSLLVLASAALTAQLAQQENARQGNVIPLKNWAAPLYWQPNQVERVAVPQLQFSSNAISTNALTFVAITPCRLVDTRGSAAGFIGVTPFDGPGAPAGGGVLTFPVQSSTQTSTTAPAPCGAIPSIAQAYSVNLTVVPTAAGAVDNVTLWPAGSTQPVVATLNDPQGIIAQNAAIVPAGTPSGGISFHSTGPAAVEIIIDMNGYYAAPSDLNGNTAIGLSALASNTTGTNNTAVGSDALAVNTTGEHNTAVGAYTLEADTTGGANTAVGNEALQSNTTGSGNSAVGGLSLTTNTTGNNNAAIGQWSLENNTTGSNNTASGQAALQDNTTGSGNTASGQNALNANTTGNQNTAVGFQAMMTNNAGGSVAFGANAMQLSVNACCDAAFGTQALQNNTFGQLDTAIGGLALSNNTTGNNNIAVGFQAALAVSGVNSNNIHIGSQGVAADGAAANSGVIRIGTVGTQTSTYIAGIWGNTPNTTNLLVCVDANGTVGTTGCTSTPSSRRFKEHISEMGDSSSKLFQLRPVTFFYKPEYDDGSHTLQYGLIAEEVVKLYPEMVGYDKDGQPNSVKYQSLAPMLLNEVQKQNAELQKQNAQLQNEVQSREEQNRKLEERLAAVEALLSSQPSTPARPASSQ